VGLGAAGAWPPRGGARAARRAPPAGPRRRRRAGPPDPRGPAPPVGRRVGSSRGRSHRDRRFRAAAASPGGRAARAARRQEDDMRYLLLIYGDETVWAEATPEEMEATMAAHGAFSEATGAEGILRGGEALQPTATA